MKQLFTHLAFTMLLSPFVASGATLSASSVSQIITQEVIDVSATTSHNFLVILCKTDTGTVSMTTTFNGNSSEAQCTTGNTLAINSGPFSSGQYTVGFTLKNETDIASTVTITLNAGTGAGNVGNVSATYVHNVPGQTTCSVDYNPMVTLPSSTIFQVAGTAPLTTGGSDNGILTVTPEVIAGSPSLTNQSDSTATLQYAVVTSDLVENWNSAGYWTYSASKNLLVAPTKPADKEGAYSGTLVLALSCL